MKTLTGINQEIEQAKKDYFNAIENDQTGNKEKSLLRKLNEVKLYLEHNPDVDYLKKTVNRLENKQKLIKESFVYDESRDEDSNDFRRKEHYKINGMADIKRQLKNLYFILEY